MIPKFLSRTVRNLVDIWESPIVVDRQQYDPIQGNYIAVKTEKKEKSDTRKGGVFSVECSVIPFN